MKKALTLLAFYTCLSITSSFADDCSGDKCVGDIVIDSNDNIGEIIRIEKDQVTFRSSSGPEFTYPEPQLAKSTTKNKNISRGVIVIDELNNIGEVEHIFEDGRTVYKTPDGYKHLKKNVSPRVSELNGVVEKGKVIDSNNNIGVVKMIFADGRVQFETSDQQVYIKNFVSPEVQELGKIEVKGNIIDDLGNIGVAQTLFQDGRVLFTTKVGAEMISSQVYPEVTDFNGVKRGTYVIDENDYIGKVEMVFEDGRASLKSDQGRKWTTSKFTPDIQKLAPYATGKLVIDNDENIGVISNVFKDGRIRYKLESGHSLIAKKLDIEVPTHPEYSLDTYYSTDDYQVVKAKKFFSGRQVLVESVLGKQSVETSLLIEVENYLGLSKGEKLLNSLGLEVLLERAFKNGTFLYSLKVSEKGLLCPTRERPTLMSGRFIQAKSLSEGTIKDLLIEIESGLKLAEENASINDSPYLTAFSVFRHEDDEKLKRTLLKAIKRGPSPAKLGEEKTEVELYLKKERALCPLIP